uniref:Uncharacterized protein n=1 Tax=Setaria italica TaxID=4555 RepID=K3YF25_SETIT
MSSGMSAAALKSAMRSAASSGVSAIMSVNRTDSAAPMSSITRQPR